MLTRDFQLVLIMLFLSCTHDSCMWHAQIKSSNNNFVSAAAEVAARAIADNSAALTHAIVSEIIAGKSKAEALQALLILSRALATTRAQGNGPQWQWIGREGHTCLPGVLNCSGESTCNRRCYACRVKTGLHVPVRSRSSDRQLKDQSRQPPSMEKLTEEPYRHSAACHASAQLCNQNMFGLETKQTKTC